MVEVKEFKYRETILSGDEIINIIKQYASIKSDVKPLWYSDSNWIDGEIKLILTEKL